MIRPIATPATAALIGTPASISPSDPPHTDAIDELPLDSRMSDTTRIVYGKSSYTGTTASTLRSARKPWPTSRRDWPRSGLTSLVAHGGGLLSMLKRFLLSPRAG